MTPSPRPVTSVEDVYHTVEGAGLPVRRAFPTTRRMQHDPFLLLDHFGPVSWAPGEASGVPDHPHRGFETVTYILEGAMEHRDSAGGGAVLRPGDVQWMTAGAGIVHAEMPEADFKRRGGVLHGFQLWVNLPATHKMAPPRYQDIAADRIPAATSADGRVTARVIAGEALGARARIDTHTPIGYVHFTLRPGASIDHPVAPEQNTFVYVFKGEIRAGADAVTVGTTRLALFGGGTAVRLAVPETASGPAELILLSGTPIGEPVARYGPFVMNTHQEIRQAVADYQAGRMGRIRHGSTAQ
ncbi:MAG: pirin family protein [Nitrospirae bacterium]|nr:pirin family protein [Nitrospirota bacterium]